MAVNSYKDDEKLTEKSKAVTLKRLFSYLLAYKWQILLVLVLMFYGVAISLLNPIMIESAIDRYIGKNNIPGLFRLMGIALILNLFVVLAMKIRMYIMAKVCNNILLTIRQQLYTHIQKLDFAFFDSRPTGKILSRIIGDINSLKDVLSNSVTTLIPDMITVIAVVGIMFTKNPKLAAASLISTPFMVFGMFFIEVHAHPKWQAFRKKSSNLNAFIHEDMSGMRIMLRHVHCEQHELPVRGSRHRTSGKRHDPCSRQRQDQTGKTRRNGDHEPRRKRHQGSRYHQALNYLKRNALAT